MSIVTADENPNVSHVRKRMRGYSMIELVVVLALMMVLSAMALPRLFNYKRLYQSEDQAIKVMDLMREAGQLALTTRRTVQIQLDINNQARPVVRMVDTTNGLIKTVPLYPMSEIRMDVPPTGVGRPNPPNYADAAFVAGVWTANFRSDGSVVNGAGVPISATLFSWPPRDTGGMNARQTSEVRAVTIFGGSGAVRYWKYDGATYLPYQ